MLKVNDVIDLFNISDKLTTNEKGLIGIAVAKYRLNGEIIDFSGNERVCDLFDLIIRPVIDMEIDKAAGVSKARSVAGSKGGKSKAKRNNILNDKSKANVANAKSDAIASEQAIASNVANDNFDKQSFNESKLGLKGFEGSSHEDQQPHDSTSKNVVDGGVNNIIYNTTITKDETVSKNGVGEILKDNTTIINGSSNEDLNPKRKTVVPIGRGFKSGKSPDSKISRTPNDNGINTVTDGCSTVNFDDETVSKNGGGEILKDNTTIINNDSFNEDSNPKSKSVVLTEGEFKLGGKPDLEFSTDNKNNVTATSVVGSFISPEDEKNSYELLKQVGVWEKMAKELARTRPYSRIKANVDLKTNDFKSGKVNNLGAVVVKAIKEDHAANVEAMEKLKQPVKSDIPLGILESAKRISKTLD